MNKIVLIVLMALSLSTWAESKTVILDLPTMNCSMCPITVKKALKNVKGVTHADVSYEGKQAVVSIDDELTSPDALIDATTNAGYPSTVKLTDKP
jgi:periplasmic mercuric ion binding protein